jgi:type IV secretion system protein TrbE
MVKIGLHLVRDDGKDHSLPSVLPYRQFLADGSIDLRGQGITVGRGLRGPSPEVSDLADLATRSRQLAAAFVHLSTGDVVQLIYHREPAPEPPERIITNAAARLVDRERRAQFTAENHWITTTRLYLSHQFDPPVRRLLKAALFATNGPQRQTRNELLREYAMNRFAAFEDAAASTVTLTRLSDVEMFRDLLMSVTYHNYPAALPEPHVRLNDVIGCERFIGGYEPFINGYHLRPVCITAYPAVTVPQILAVLLRQPGRMTVSARFICRDPSDAKLDLEREKQHYNREILGTVWKTVKSWFGGNTQVDQDTTTQLADINAAIAASAAGMAFGWATVVAVIRDRDPDRADLRARDLLKECHTLGIMARIEDLHATEAIESTWPANGTSNVERILVTSANFADLTLPADHWPGLPYVDSPFYPERTPAPMVCGGAGSKSPFYFPTHINGVANQLIIGPSGSGKSSLLGAMACAYLQIPNARIAWLDLDYSSFVLAHLLGDQADYRDMGAQDTPPLCPLAFLDQADGLEWLFGWFERLFARWNLELDERQSEEFAFCLREARRTGVRTISGLRAIIPGEQGRIRRILRHYSTYWKQIFDGEPAAAANSRVAIFEMRGLVGLGKRASAPATELILRSIISNLDGSPVWILADEMWSLLGDEVSAEWLFDSIRTLRKKNSGLVGCTQSLVEIVNSPYRDLLLESCPGKILLPNSEAGGEYVREAYYKLGLNEHEIAIIANASPQRQYYYRSPIGSRLFTLALGPVAKAIVASTGYQDVQRARAILSESPNGHFLDAWLSERLPAYEYELPVIANGGQSANHRG